jgi:phosphate transport system substrate-binding protein
MTQKAILGIALTLILIMPTTMLLAHADTSPNPPPDGVNISIIGAGSSFVFPLMDKWRVAYHGLYPGVSFNYASIGSGAGINQFTKKTVDFGATDVPLQPSDQKAAPNSLTFVESIGAIAVAYNIPSGEYKNYVAQVLPSGLKLDGPTLSKIFEGKIIYWNDPAIKAQNPGWNLPAARITVVHRSDGSGTTYAFTDYLTKVSPDWATDIGTGKSVPWRAGIGAPNNAGVASYVISTPYSIGYVELAYALQNHMSYAYVKNADGTAYLPPTLQTTAHAASTITNLPQSNGDWSKVSITNAPGSNSYPLASLTYIVAYANRDALKGTDVNQADTLVHMIYWMVTDGQAYASSLNYVPLPQNIVQNDLKGLGMFKFNGNQLWTNSGSDASTSSINTNTDAATSTSSGTSSSSSSSTTSNANSGGFDWYAWLKQNLK